MSCCLADKPLRMMKSFGEHKSSSASAPPADAEIDATTASCSSSTSSRKSSKVGHVVRKSKRSSVTSTSSSGGGGGGEGLEGNRDDLLEYHTAENERTGLRMKQRKEFRR